MRRDQKRSERRRTIVIITACVVVALVIIGLAAVPLIKQNMAASGPLAELGVSESKAGCQEVVKKKATGNQEHKPIGTPITYDDAPPAFGAHWPTPAPFERKFYTADDRPEVEYLVHNLEHGYNLLWYDDTIAKDSDKLAAVKAIASKFEGTELGRQVHRAALDEQGRQGVPQGHPRRADALVRRRRPERRQQAGGHLAVLRRPER